MDVRFDSWESGEYLCHYRTKGSKNGVRRYQQEDGTWTPLGLERRKDREGWGEEGGRGGGGSKKEYKRALRAERYRAKAAAKADALRRREAEKKAKADRDAKARLEKNNRNRKLSEMTDAELKDQIARLKLEREYKEAKGPSLFDTIMNKGTDMVTKFMENKQAKEQLKLDKIKTELAEKHWDAEYALKQEEMKLRFAELQARNKDSDNAVEIEKQRTATQHELSEQARARAEQTKSETEAYGTKAKKIEMKSQLKRAKRGVSRREYKLANRGYDAEDRRQTFIEKLFNKSHADGQTDTANAVARDYMSLYGPKALGYPYNSGGNNNQQQQQNNNNQNNQKQRKKGNNKS